MTPGNPTRNVARRRAPLLRCLITVFAAVLMASPAVAHPICLSHLLRLPFEELLRLEITAPATATRLRAGLTGARPIPSNGGAA